MSMGRRTPRQVDLLSAPVPGPSHRFYEALNALLDEAGFDRHVEELCSPHFAADNKPGRKSLPPGAYFRMLLVGYFEGIGSERGIEWRCADSLSLRRFIGLIPGESVPDHSTLSLTRRRFPPDVFSRVFDFVLSIVEQQGLLRGRVLGVDSTYLRADYSVPRSQVDTRGGDNPCVTLEVGRSEERERQQED